MKHVITLDEADIKRAIDEHLVRRGYKVESVSLSAQGIANSPDPREGALQIRADVTVTPSERGEQ